MLTLNNLPDKIPVFPLPGVLVFPRTQLPLNIFEPQYLVMLDDVLKSSHRLIGMVQPVKKPDETGNLCLQKIGCAGRVTSFSETKDGTYTITLSGINRFRVVEQQSGFTPYICATVDWSDFEADQEKKDVDRDFNRPNFLKTLARFFDMTSMSTDWDNLQNVDEELLINSLSMLCPFEPAEKQALLEAVTLTTRRKTLATLIEFALAGDSTDGVLQ